MSNFEEAHLKGTQQLTVEHLSKVKTLSNAKLDQSFSIHLEKKILVKS
jgi:hypothetical protein